MYPGNLNYSELFINLAFLEDVYLISRELIMELCYRGILYSFNPFPTSTQMSDRIIFGKYRGVALRFSQQTSIDLPQSPLKLTYRGVSYLKYGNFSVTPKTSQNQV